LPTERRAICVEAATPHAAYHYDTWGLPQGAGNYATGIWTQSTSLITSTLAGQIASRQILRYASYVYDSESGLYHCSARYYDSATRQWTTADSAKADGEESAYQYCGGNPITNVDPSGDEWYAWKHHNMYPGGTGKNWDISDNHDMYFAKVWIRYTPNASDPSQWWVECLDWSDNIRLGFTSDFADARILRYAPSRGKWVTAKTPTGVSAKKHWGPSNKNLMWASSVGDPHGVSYTEDGGAYKWFCGSTSSHINAGGKKQVWLNGKYTSGTCVRIHQELHTGTLGGWKGFILGRTYIPR
jgi:RHS repeat-associated protein